MTDTTTTPATANDQDDGDDGDLLVYPDQLSEDDLPESEREEIMWLTTGGIMCRIGGVWHRLRRPNMGELRKLHEALEALKDQSQTVIEEVQLRAKALERRQMEASKLTMELLPKLQAATGDEEALELSEQVTELTTMLATLKRDQQRCMEMAKLKTWEMGEAWWRQVFKTLRPKDGPQAPKELPTWTAAPEIHQTAIQHWMRVPLGRGGYRPNGSR